MIKKLLTAVVFSAVAGVSVAAGIPDPLRIATEGAYPPFNGVGRRRQSHRFRCRYCNGSL